MADGAPEGIWEFFEVGADGRAAVERLSPAFVPDAGLEGNGSTTHRFIRQRKRVLNLKTDAIGGIIKRSPSK